MGVYYFLETQNNDGDKHIGVHVDVAIANDVVTIIIAITLVCVSFLSCSFILSFINKNNNNDSEYVIIWIFKQHINRNIKQMVWLAYIKTFLDRQTFCFHQYYYYY